MASDIPPNEIIQLFKAGRHPDYPDGCVIVTVDAGTTVYSLEAWAAYQ